MSEDVEDYGTIYLDMDGVLADFIGGLENAFGTEGAEDFLGTSGSSTKKPPLIHPPSPFGFSENPTIFSLSNFNDPYLPGG